ERTRAMKEITKNPFPITPNALERGKDLFVIYCGICHGEKGDGAGYLVRDNGGKYPAQPANFVSDPFITSSEGRYYHAIMHGKNTMGSYADKLSYEERWDVIHYIRSLQSGVKSLVYNENENTFNNAVPMAKIVKKTDDKKAAESKADKDLGSNMPQAAGQNEKK
ncbi:MAG TPA: cytochrome c, partial [Saprospiraceae bacterium]|nr:cytochrome c [Saprospiraceae bacterium]